MSIPLRCLCPGLRSQTQLICRATSSTYLSFYHTVRSYSTEQAPVTPRIRGVDSDLSEKPYLPEPYPRITPQKGAIDFQTFQERYKDLVRGESRSDEIVVRGRIWSSRIAGSKLAFIDIVQNNCLLQKNVHQLQCLVNFEKLSGSDLSPSIFKSFFSSLRRGDVFSFKGIPHRTPRNELTVLVTELPQLLSRCNQPLPDEIKDQETLIRNRHVDLLLNPRPSDIIRLRSEITGFLRRYLSDQGHLEVQTPILADTAGGAVARPFHTSATEFPERQIALRIAPELWLKRLVLGGFEKVFEIGPSFRNEGKTESWIDRDHNPEFTTCEFYRTYADLEELIDMTETMFLGLSKVVAAIIVTNCRSLRPIAADFSPPYPRLDFIPAIEAAIGRKLPVLTSPEAQAVLVQICSEKSVPLPYLPTVPRLLDKLSSTYLESQCVAPTWIINHPECLSPLSKSFDHPDNQQRVAARAELFVFNQELVNTYEEENSPTEQRRKFEEQLLYHEGDAEAGVDESYLQALEWGLPPTGGWGCGVDRLCMLFSESTRIADVLSFGTLRNVVSLRHPDMKRRRLMVEALTHST